ncbi:hypothetical protein ARMSODRAFT_444477 [Armillaria solidipes]|uniref:Secreted protein n=1 Tax=Armillaria solidipes TaxID=1076256 RepID=A0A2H3BDM3_9AGAR|nr:hypothetical protein ARMSODRAFT_444477 [Armillaria solidipes]
MALTLTLPLLLVPTSLKHSTVSSTTLISNVATTSSYTLPGTAHATLLRSIIEVEHRQESSSHLSDPSKPCVLWTAPLWTAQDRNSRHQ